MRCALATWDDAADNSLFRMTLTNAESQTFWRPEKGATGIWETPALSVHIDTADMNVLSYVSEESWRHAGRKRWINMCDPAIDAMYAGKEMSVAFLTPMPPWTKII